jgi:serine protease Do
MQLEPLAPEERLAMGLGDAGVRVIEVTGDPARAAGIRAGDVIVQLAGEPVASPEDLEERAQAAPEGRSVPVLIHRDGTPVFIALRIPAS